MQMITFVLEVVGLVRLVRFELDRLEFRLVELLFLLISGYVKVYFLTSLPRTCIG
jgi:hypothetical protein